MKISGIYQIQSKLKPNRFYIGSSINITSRWHLHKNQLEHNEHHSTKMQRHFNKYKNDLTFIILEPCFPNYLLIREQYYIDELNPYFNECKIAGSRLGGKSSEAAKAKISKAMMGHRNSLGCKRSDEFKEMVRRTSTGRKHILTEDQKKKYSHVCSEETKQKLRIANIGKTTSPEIRKKISDSMKGKISWSTGLTKETNLTLKNISNKLKGRPSWNKGTKGLMTGMKGKTHSEETKQKISETKKRLFQLKKIA